MDNKTCEACGTIFYGYPSILRGRRFCSQECTHKYQQGEHHPLFGNPRLDMVGHNNPRYIADIKERPCQHCNKLFRPKPWKLRAGEGKFCSKQCVYAHNAIFVACTYCGKQFRCTPYRKRTSRLLFCSKKCSGLYKTGPRNPFYGKHHSKETLKALIGKIHARPNQAEARVIKLIEDHGLPFKYIGNGAEIIDGLNPDFIRTDGKRQIIEVFGLAFHAEGMGLKSRIPYRQTYRGRVEALERQGFEALIIWDKDLKNLDAVASRVKQFAKGGDVIC